VSVGRPSLHYVDSFPLFVDLLVVRANLDRGDVFTRTDHIAMQHAHDVAGLLRHKVTFLQLILNQRVDHAELFVNRVVAFIYICQRANKRR
jgi:hypothetical protein